ncbi:unnamed protein product [Durusdinium trenchii]|uniref:Uncharacterized protein n=1 Tax=Durusdinium trenchii TaxID=1381693 RepID=A0ABP0I2V1_9DINO
MLDDQPTHLLVGKICSSTVWPLWLKNIETQKSRFCPSSVFVTQMAEAGEADKELEVPKDGRAAHQRVDFVGVHHQQGVHHLFGCLCSGGSGENLGLRMCFPWRLHGAVGAGQRWLPTVW